MTWMVAFYCARVKLSEANPPEPQLIKFEKKVEAGSEFIQTQAVYDHKLFKYFIEYARQFPVKIMAGVILLTSAQMARFIKQKCCWG